MPANAVLFSGFNKLAAVSSGNLSNAAFVGPKTVKAPLLLSVATKPAALTAATRVV